MKINYQKELQIELEIIKNSGKRPKLLLHACCGPCFTLPYEELKDYFDITIMYNNSNIYPKEEHDRRLEELKKYVKDINAPVKIIEIPYDNETYIQDLLPYKDYPEGFDRCRLCFRKRLSFGYKFASENNFDYFGTVMSISRYKNSQDLNSIGFDLQTQYPNVKWLPADFKKNDGYNKSLEIVRKYNMYFQHYCGCQFSIRKEKSEI